MASNLSTIGFHFATPEAFQSEMLGCAGEASAQIDCLSGCYAIWNARSGAQIWFHCAPNESGPAEILGLTPFFEGKSEVVLGLRRTRVREGDNAFEGAFEAVVNPQDDAPEGSYPLVFDAVDFALSGGLALPARMTVRLCAFAREIQAYADAEAYVAAQSSSDEKPALAPQAFIPIGMFSARAEGADTPEDATDVDATVLFTGRVLEHTPLVNERTGRPFVWLLVQTYDATLDVIADPAVIAGDVAEGGTVSVSAYLFGRLLG